MDKACGSTNQMVGEDAYRMDHSSRGTCVILAFDYIPVENKNSAQRRDERALEQRPAATTESAMCEATFQRLGFEVQTHVNLNSTDFKRTAEHVMKKMPEDVDAFVLVILGHAEGDKAAFANGPVDFKNIWKAFLPDVEHPKLAGKPKLFFVDTDVPAVSRGRAPIHKKNYIVPSVPDLLLFDSSFPGFPGLPFSHEGTNISPFIYHLTQALDQHGQSDAVASLLVVVTNEVLAHNQSQTQQAVPLMSSTLRKTLRFPRADSIGY